MLREYRYFYLAIYLVWAVEIGTFNYFKINRKNLFSSDLKKKKKKEKENNFFSSHIEHEKIVFI